jgi:hypothetical protein
VWDATTGGEEGSGLGMLVVAMGLLHTMRSLDERVAARDGVVAVGSGDFVFAWDKVLLSLLTVIVLSVLEVTTNVSFSFSLTLWQ